MSAERGNEGVKISRCASCGVKEDSGGDIKLRDCSACHLVKYCGVKCQKEHRKKHKGVCKQRAAELDDEILFRQPEGSDLGDCPICFLPLPLDHEKFVMMMCCSKLVCDGCNYANQMREIKEKQYPKCPFCRRPVPKSQEEEDKLLNNRAEMNDPVAMRELGIGCYEDEDFQSAFEYHSKAAQLGDVGSHHELAIMYHEGHGVEKDESKALHHWEQAAIGGHPYARHNLGVIEWDNGNHERAIKHWIIAAKLGFDVSLDRLKHYYRKGFVSKDDLAEALRGYQAAVDATKSPQRAETEKARA